MATTIGDLFVRLGVDMQSLNADLEGAEKRLEKFGTGMFFLGSRITASLGLPIAAAGALVAKFGLEFDTAMTESMAIMDKVSPEIRAQMEKTAMTVSETTKFSSAEAAKGFYALASAGLDAATQVGALPIAARFAQAGVMELAKATDYLASVQAAMGVATETSAEKVQDMARVSDVLTKANNMALGTVEDFAQGLVRSGQALRLFNKPIEEGVAVLAAYASQGIKGNLAGQQLYMTIRDLSKAAIAHKQAFKDAGIAVYDEAGNMKNLADIISDLEVRMAGMSDEQKRQQLLMLGLPDRALKAIQSLVGFSDAIRQYESDLRSAGGTTQTVSDNQMLGLQNQIAILQHSFENVAIEIFKSFVPVLQDYVVPIIKDVLAGFKSLATFIEDLSSPMKAAVLGFGALGVAIGPFIVFLGGMSLLASAAIGGISSMAEMASAAALKFAVMTGSANTLVAATTGLSAASVAANGVLGLTGQAVSAVVLNQQQLRAAMDLAATGAMAGAKAMGMNAVAVTDMGIEARIAVANANRLAIGQAAVTDALAASAPATGLWGAALGLLTNPVTWLIGGLAALAAGYIYWRHLQSEEKAAVLENVDAFNAETTALENNLKTFKDRITYTADFIGPTRNLGDAITELAKASGLSGNAFLEETDKSSKLTDALYEQLKARKELMASIIDDVRQARDKAFSDLVDLKSQLQNVGSGTAHTSAVDEFGRVVDTGAMTMQQRKDEIAALTTQISRAQEKWNKAEADYLNAIGQKKPFAAEIPHVVGTDPETGGSNVKLPDKLTAFQKKAQDLADSWTGNAKAMNLFEAAWKLVTKAGLDDAEATDKAAVAYIKLKKETGETVPELEKLFATQIASDKASAAFEVWSDLLTAGEERVVSGIDGMTTAFDMLNSKAATDAFFKQNETALKGLIPLMDILPPKVQTMIQMYQAWKASIEGISPAFQKAQQAASDFMDKGLVETAAKTKDLQDSIDMFTDSAGSAHARALKTGLAKIEVDQKEHLRKMLVDSAYFTGKDAELFKTKYDLQIQEDKDYNAAYEKFIDLQWLKTLGFNQKAIAAAKNWSHEHITQVGIAEAKWQEFHLKILSVVDAISKIGGLATSLGLGTLGSALSDAGASAKKMADGLAAFHKAQMEGDIGGQIAAIATVATTVVDAYNQMSQAATKSERVMRGAMSGAAIGATIGTGIVPVYGTIIGAVIGGLIGAFKGDPAWATLQKTIRNEWTTNVSDALAKQIAIDSVTLGSDMNGMLANFSKIIEAGGGFTNTASGSVDAWARRLQLVFRMLSPETLQVGDALLSSSQAAKILDDGFGTLLASGTQVNGLVSTQITRLVALERQYQTGSKAIKDFVDAQLTLLTTGLGKMTGQFSAGLTNSSASEASAQKISDLNDKILKDQAIIDDFAKKPPTNEKQRVQLLLTQNDLAATRIALMREQAKQDAADAAVLALIGPEGQKSFDTLSRVALTTFNALIGNGKSLVEAMDAIGPSIDTLSAAADTFGFKGNDAFNKLSHWRDLIKTNQGVFDSIEGLNNVMTALSNLGMMTQSDFTDLGSLAAGYFQTLIEGGATAEEAEAAMHPTLQKLWELQKKYGFTLDENTQKILDQAEADGTVGDTFMSANDRMIAGIDALIARFDAFLTYLGVDIPGQAATAAGAVEDEFGNIHPNITVTWQYHQTPGQEPPDGSGDTVDPSIEPPAPHIPAGNSVLVSPQAMEAMYASTRSMMNQSQITIITKLDGKVVARNQVKHIPNELTRLGK